MLTFEGEITVVMLSLQFPAERIPRNSRGEQNKAKTIPTHRLAKPESESEQQENKFPVTVTLQTLNE